MGSGLWEVDFGELGEWMESGCTQNALNICINAQRVIKCHIQIKKLSHLSITPF